MKLKRGTYPGASEYLYFDQDLKDMRREQLESLLSRLLHYGSPGRFDVAPDVRQLLGWAEEGMKEECGL